MAEKEKLKDENGSVDKELDTVDHHPVSIDSFLRPDNLKDNAVEYKINQSMDNISDDNANKHENSVNLAVMDSINRNIAQNSSNFLDNLGENQFQYGASFDSKNNQYGASLKSTNNTLFRNEDAMTDSIRTIEQIIVSRENSEPRLGISTTNSHNFEIRQDSILDQNTVVCPITVHATAQFENYNGGSKKHETTDNLIELGLKVENVDCLRQTPIKNVKEKKIAKSSMENFDENKANLKEVKVDVKNVASSSKTPRKTRHGRVLRSRSWSARTRNDSLNTADIILLRERLLRTQSYVQPSAIRGFTRQQKMTLVSLALIDFMSFCSMSIMAPFFPREANEKGMTDSVSGFVFSFYALVMFLTSPILGKILPSVGAKFMLLSGMFMAGSCNLLFGVLEYIIDYETFTSYCFIIRGLEALGASAYNTASFVFVVNTFPNNIGTVLGILETFIGLGMSAGPAIGGLLYSIGGFGLPFYVLGISMILTLPVNCILLPSQNDYSPSQKSGSVFKLVKLPAVVIRCVIIVIVSNSWAFLDPTLEPHLRQFDLDAHQVGLIFLLFSGLYGLSSPLWGWLADRINNHWSMMVWGLAFCSVGLSLLGPSPILPFLQSSLWLNLVGLSIIGVSVALTLLPTFQGVLSSSIEDGGYSDNIATYSVVAGVWSCMYSLGEVMGPSLGGVLLKNYGFPICSTVMAFLTLIMSVITFIFFSCHKKQSNGSESFSEDSRNSDKAWQTSSAPLSGRPLDILSPSGNIVDKIYDEHQPLLFGHQNGVEDLKKKRQSYGGAGLSSEDFNESTLKRNLKITTNGAKTSLDENHNVFAGTSEELKALIQSDYYQQYLDESLIAFISKENTFDTKNEDDDNDINDDGIVAFSLADDFIKYNQDKVKYYKQSRKTDRESNPYDNKEVTDVRGTVIISGSGACEV